MKYSTVLWWGKLMIVSMTAVGRMWTTNCCISRCLGWGYRPGHLLSHAALRNVSVGSEAVSWGGEPNDISRESLRILAFGIRSSIGNRQRCVVKHFLWHSKLSGINTCRVYYCRQDSFHSGVTSKFCNHHNNIALNITLPLHHSNKHITHII